MSAGNRRTTTAKALERELLQAAARGDGLAVHRLAQTCRQAFTHAELADALGRMAWSLSVYAARVPQRERRQVASDLANAEGLLRLMGAEL